MLTIIMYAEYSQSLTYAIILCCLSNSSVYHDFGPVAILGQPANENALFYAFPRNRKYWLKRHAVHDSARTKYSVAVFYEYGPFIAPSHRLMKARQRVFHPPCIFCHYNILPQSGNVVVSVPCKIFMFESEHFMDLKSTTSTDFQLHHNYWDAPPNGRKRKSRKHFYG